MLVETKIERRISINFEGVDETCGGEISASVEYIAEADRTIIGLMTMCIFTIGRRMGLRVDTIKDEMNKVMADY